MASQYTSDLSRTILKDIYGDLAEKVVGCLLDYGRLTASQLSKYTNIPTPAIRRALVPLIQNKFVLYWIHPDSPKICHYYANPAEVIRLLAIPQILAVVADKYPDKPNSVTSKAPEILKNIFAYGHIRASDYIEGSASQLAAELELQEGGSVQTAADHEYHLDRARTEINKTMTDLLTKKFLSPLFAFDFHPRDDMYDLMYKTHYGKLPRSQSETSRKVAATDAANAEMNELLAQRDAANAGLITEETLRAKTSNGSSAGTSSGAAAAAAAAAASRRVRRNVAAANTLSGPRLVVNPETVLAVNYDKFLLMFRNDELAAIASRTIGKISGQVYRSLLRCYETKLLRCSQKVISEGSFYITTTTVINALDPNIDLVNSIVNPTVNRNGLKRPQDELENEDEDEYGNTSKRPRSESVPFITDDEPQDFEDDAAQSTDFPNGSNSHTGNGYGSTKKFTAMDVNKHLELLAASPLSLLVKAGNRGGGEWFVPFDELRTTMKRLRYDEIIRNKFGTSAIRILRIIREKGMANDELLARVALLRADTISKLCTQLHEFGALDLQEVPRSADRAPSKTIFMWCHTPSRAYGLVAEYILKTLTRLMERIQAERQNHPVLLAKLRREDVKQNEDLYLTAQEKQEIAQLRQAEERLLIQINRVHALSRVFTEY
ncbi:uncharacterized protein SAPINGB_P001526 [Magnusiomyces paraingens]|uniref:DNA-directed RNA polymerase III subunit RPC3 n=1 Tax=Magnusiomyces paraingens TaxID=2606893 RepID=A0A5E8B6F1_9ASCO|nr:uncharacterized protein SAPINGB_P001526 [Saprochaete ingens]VVT47065.1 unnamed protein product [Saprochaete ingens]